MVSEKIVISNRTGLHVRPAGILSHAAEMCSSTVELITENKIVNCRSLLNILSAEIKKGSEVEVRCTGLEEEKDLEHMLHVIQYDLEN